MQLMNITCHGYILHTCNFRQVMKSSEDFKSWYRVQLNPLVPGVH